MMVVQVLDSWFEEVGKLLALYTHIPPRPLPLDQRRNAVMAQDFGCKASGIKVL